MQEEPRDWERLGGKFIWPDRLTYHYTEDGSVEAIFIIDKGNNRALTTERTVLVRLFEQLGMKIMLSYAGQLLTLDEFNSGQGYRQSLVGNSRQQIYNAKSELKRLEAMLPLVSEEKLEQLQMQIAARKRLLNSVEVSPIQPETTDDLIDPKKRAALIARGGQLIKELEPISPALSEQMRDAVGALIRKENNSHIKLQKLIETVELGLPPTKEEQEALDALERLKDPTRTRTSDGVVGGDVSQTQQHD